MTGQADDPFPVALLELPELDEDHAPVLASRRMPGSGRISNVAAGGEIAALVLKDAVQNEKLFAAWMFVMREPAAGRIAHDRRGASLFAADAKQHPPIHAFRGARHPFEPAGMDEGTLREVVVEQHGQSSDLPPSTTISAPSI